MDRTSVEIEETINANGKRRRSDVWTHFEEVEISSKTSDGILQKVVKIKCKGCNQYFTKSKCGTTSTLKKHIKVRCLQQGGGRRRSDVWAHFEEVEISSKISNGILQKVVKIKCKDCNQYFTKSKCGTTSALKRHIEARHPHLQQVSSQNEDMVRAEVLETDKTAKMGGTRRRSDVWAQFEEVVVTEKKQKGLNLEVKKLKCKKCKKLLTMPKDGSTTTLKRHMEETCAIRNGQKSLLDYCTKS